jgi:hypothetical protein
MLGWYAFSEINPSSCSKILFGVNFKLVIAVLDYLIRVLLSSSSSQSVSICFILQALYSAQKVNKFLIVGDYL